MKQLPKYTALSLLATAVMLSGCSSDDDDNGSETSLNGAFEFRTDQPEAYTRVDRSGMPAIATALIASRDAYNDANPTDDIAGSFVPEILNSLTTLHGALDGQLAGLGLTPCTVVGDGTGSCATFAVPLIIPDTLKLDPSAAAGFPNGRQLTDPVIAVTLAVALVELTGDPAPHTADVLVGVVNPAANDRELLGSFPFLAEPFQP